MKQEIIEVNKINPYISRTHTEKKLFELQESIKRSGVIMPICVLKQEDGNYKVVKGEGRTLASKNLKIKKIPAFVYEKDEMPPSEAHIQWLSSNIIRTATIFKRADFFLEAKKLGMTNDEIAKKYNVSIKTIKEDLRGLSNMTEETKKMIANKKISFQYGRRISENFKGKLQNDLLKLAIQYKVDKYGTETLLNKARTLKTKSGKFSIVDLRKELREIINKNVALRKDTNPKEQHYYLLQTYMNKLSNDKNFVALLKKENFEPLHLENVI